MTKQTDMMTRQAEIDSRNADHIAFLLDSAVRVGRRVDRFHTIRRMSQVHPMEVVKDGISRYHKRVARRAACAAAVVAVAGAGAGLLFGGFYALVLSFPTVWIAFEAADRHMSSRDFRVME